MARHHKLDQDVPDGRTFQDTSDRWPKDQRLRAFGFVILARPKHGPNIWGRHGKEYTEADALRECAHMIAELER